MKAKRKPAKRAAPLSITAAPTTAVALAPEITMTPGLFRANGERLDDDFVTEEELAKVRGVSVRTLARERAEKRGPPYCKIARKHFYSVAGWRKFLAARMQESV